MHFFDILTSQKDQNPSFSKFASRHNRVHFFDISTSKGGPGPSVFYTLTWTRASRHNGVHFFDVSTSKSGPGPSVFYTFDLDTCFAPQRRALFRHLNFFTLLPAATKSGPRVLYILTSKCASCHNGVQFFVSYLTTWLRTRREPVFDPPEPQTIGTTR